jgi:hypothetical protein
MVRLLCHKKKETNTFWLMIILTQIIHDQECLVVHCLQGLHSLVHGLRRPGLGAIGTGHGSRAKSSSPSRRTLSTTATTTASTVWLLSSKSSLLVSDEATKQEEETPQPGHNGTHGVKNTSTCPHMEHGIWREKASVYTIIITTFCPTKNCLLVSGEALFRNSKNYRPLMPLHHCS